MNFEKTQLDKVLDDALESYSEAEPRIGFESRILANLRAAPAQPWWRLKFAYASAAMAVICVMLYGAWRFGLLNNRQEIAPPAIAHRMPLPEVARSGPRVTSTMPARERSRRFRIRRDEAGQQRVALAPQLPVPMPLTQQEKLLLALARENPNEVASTLAWQERMREPAENPTVSDEGEQQ